MKIIDEKGRLFGKINIIDFSIIIFLLILAPMFYFGYKISLRNKVSKPVMTDLRSMKYVEINCKFIKIDPEVAKLIKVGDKEIDSMGEVIGEIISLGEIKPNQYSFTLGGSNIIINEDPGLKEVNAKLKLKVVIKGNRAYYKEKAVGIDSTVDFNTDKYSLETFAVEDKDNKPKTIEKWVQAQVRFSELIPELDKVIRMGDEAKDARGDTVGRIEKIITRKLSDVYVIKNEKWVAISDPYKKDLVVILNLRCTEMDGVLYFNNSPVKIGNAITFTTKYYSIYGTLISMEIS